MASIPLTEEQIEVDFVLLNFEKVGLSDEQFVELCGDNRDSYLEFTAQCQFAFPSLPLFRP